MSRYGTRAVPDSRRLYLSNKRLAPNNVDIPILPLVKLINERTPYITDTSCSGHKDQLTFMYEDGTEEKVVCSGVPYVGMWIKNKHIPQLKKLEQRLKRDVFIERYKAKQLRHMGYEGLTSNKIVFRMKREGTYVKLFSDKYRRRRLENALLA